MVLYMVKSSLKPRFNKITSTFSITLPRSALIHEMYKIALGESKVPFPPSDVDGVWRGYPVRIIYAGNERVVFNLYNPRVKSKWVPMVLPAAWFYPYFSTLRDEEQEYDPVIMESIMRYYLSKARRLEAMHEESRRVVEDPRKRWLDKIDEMLLIENPYNEIVKKSVTGNPVTREDIEALLDYYVSILPGIAEAMEKLGIDKNMVKNTIERVKSYIQAMRSMLSIIEIGHDTADRIVDDLNKMITSILQGIAQKVYNSRRRMQTRGGRHGRKR